MAGMLILQFGVGCGSYNVRPDMPSEERFELAKTMFANKDYFDAKKQLKIVTLNNPGAAYVDEAQFLLAECHFHSKEYILAADEYNRLTRLYPKSPWVDNAQFKIPVCDFKLSPKPALDQTYTVRAVENFQRFIEDYPASDLIPEAERLLKVCRTKLSQKDFKAGILYRKIGDYYGAQVYFGSVIDNYFDTPFVEEATFWKAECLYKLARNDEARGTFEDLLRKYPKSEFNARARKRLQEIADLPAPAPASDESSSAAAKNTPQQR